MWDIPIVPAASLEPQSAALRNTLLAAQRRLTAFALKHDWRTHVQEPFARLFHVYADKASFDHDLLELCGLDPAMELPATYCAALEQGVLMSVSAELYRALYPQGDEESAFEKLASALTPHMRQFLNQLPRVLTTKADPTRKHEDPQLQQIVARLLEATLHHRQASITYHSKSSDRTKTYLVDPYRLAYAQGGLYLLAYVPEYGEVRTFAIERIHDVSLLDERFTPIEELPDAAFPHSLGVHSGPPERVVVEFQSAVAEYVQARVWHSSQQIEGLPSGGVRVALAVCIDRALQSWILSFGPFARVVAPERLARDIAAQIEEARAQYA